MKLVITIALAMLALSCKSAPTPALLGAQAKFRGDPNAKPEGRLSDVVEPTAYRVRFAIDPRQVVFAGSAIIDVELHAAAQTLWLHAKDLTITSAHLEQGGDIIDVSTALDEDSELLGLRATRTLAPGHAEIHLKWQGKLLDVNGLFRQMLDGRSYVYSDFEATDARRALPCFDDPRFKTPWGIAMEVPREDRAFSNAPETRRIQLANGRDLVEFAPTPPLPTYLVAMATGPFDSISGVAHGTPLRIIAPKGHAEKGRFVLENTGALLAYLESYLGQPMPFPKLDFIAVPRFSGAMENPGLVTFSAGILLSAAPSPAYRRFALGVVAHELAHLWFGDWITPDYWNELWLNEGFATWLSKKAVDHVHPSRARDVLDIANTSTAFAFDHALDERRVRQPIRDKSDIREAFDPVTYRKGGGILNMLEAWLGAKVMQKAVRHYLQVGAGGIVTTDMAAEALATSSGRSEVVPILGSFLNQTGIPKLIAELECSAEPTLTIAQRRYLPLEAQPNLSPDDVKRDWHVPVCMRFATPSTVTRHCALLTTQSTRIALPTKECPTWIVLNEDALGYFHSFGRGPQFSELPLNELSPLERLDYAHNLVTAFHDGSMDTGHVLPLLERLTRLPSAHIHDVLIDELYAVQRALVREPQRQAFASLVRRWYAPVLRDIGIEPQPLEPYWVNQSRPRILRALAELGESEFVIQAVQKRVYEALEAPEPLKHEGDAAQWRTWLHIAALTGGSDAQERFADAEKRTSRPVARALRAAAYSSPDAQFLGILLNQETPPDSSMESLANAMRTPKLASVIGAAQRVRRLSTSRKRKILARRCDGDGLAIAAALAKNDDERRSLQADIAGCMSFAAAQRESAAQYFRALPSSATTPEATP